MKKISKISILFLISFVFCLTTFFGMTSFSALAEDSSVSSDDSSVTRTISDATGLQTVLSEYNNSTDYYIINLTADIDNVTLQGTLGTSSNPFTGVFNGNGHTISNLTIDLTDVASDFGGYAGLFGVTDGATIQNLTISGTVTIITKSGETSYNVGMLCGMAKNSTFKNIYINSTLNLTYDSTLSSTYDFDFDSSTNLGGMIGTAEDSTISYCIVRSTNVFGSLELSNVDGHIYAFGALAGRMNYSTAIFNVIETTMNITFSGDFVGDVGIGGIVGVIVSGSLTNIAIANTYNITNSELSSLGEIAGSISNPAPSAGNISYIHYKQNNINRFGEGTYTYSNSSSYDYVTASAFDLTSLTSDGAGGYTYFSEQSWDPFSGDWDFSTIWYVMSSRIYLQCFNSYSVSVSNMNSSVLTCQTSLSTSYSHGTSVVLSFVFSNSGGVSMSNFYTPTALTLDGVAVATIYQSENDGEFSYVLSENDYYSITATTQASDEETIYGFDITISSVNAATSGTYSISYTTKSFSIELTTKLFDGSTEIEGTIPGYVYNANAAISNAVTTLSISNAIYGSLYSIGTSPEASVAGSFAGWYVEYEDGTSALLSSSNTLNFTFGNGYYVDDMQIYARYDFDPCNIICNIVGDGVVQIVFSNDSSTAITESGGYYSASKNTQTLILQIYIESGYYFDVDEFVDFLNTYKSLTATSEFCYDQGQSQADDGSTIYQFSLDMTVLESGFSDELVINITTSEQDPESNSLIWIIVGSVLGGIVLIGLVVLIIILIKRRGGGFGGGYSKKVKVDKKSYKNMYY